jgi:hypothetical protein
MTHTSIPPLQPSSAADRAYAALIFTTLYLVYLLTFNGVFRTIDELGLYAMTESVVQRGDFSTPQILFAKYHNPVGKIESGQAIAAAPLYALAEPLANVNNIQAVMLFNPIITALTAAMLYLIARQLQYSVRRAGALGYTFGLATLAWPYARTFLREPLVGLLFVVALFAYLTWRHTGRIRWLIGMLAMLAIATTVKSISLVIVPVFILLAAVDLLQRQRRFLPLVGAAMIGLLLLGILIAENRYTTSIDSFTQYLSGFTLTQVLTTIYGMLLSPGKGIVFYMPVILAAWLSIARVRRYRRLFWGFGVVVPLAMIIGYGNNLSWFGGQVWGPRFLMPVLPLMVLPLLDCLDRRSTWVLIAISIGLQFGPVTADWAIGHRPLSRLVRPWENSVGLNPAYWYLSPPFNQLRLWTSDHTDLLWAHPMDSGNSVFDPALPIGLLILIGSALAIMIRIAHHQAHRREWWGCLPIALIATAWLLLRGWYILPDAPDLSIDEARAIVAPATASPTAYQVFVTVSNEFHIYPMLGFMKGHFQHFWYSPVQHDQFTELAAAAVPPQRITLTIDRVHLPRDQSGNDLRDWLNQNAYPYDGGYVGGYERIAYVWEPNPIQSQPIGVMFGRQIELVRAGIGGDQFASNDIIPLQIELRKTADLPEALAIAVRLVGEAGLSIGCYTGAVQAGTLDIAAWPIGFTVLDRRGCVVPAALPPGIYQVEIGIEVPESVLTTATGESFVRVGQIHIDH